MKLCDQKELIEQVIDQMKITVHRAYRAIGLSRSMHYYQSRKQDDRQVIAALQQHVEQHPTHGFPKCFAYLPRAGKD